MKPTLFLLVALAVGISSCQKATPQTGSGSGLTEGNPELSAGIKHYSNKDYKAALQEFERLARSKPNDAEVRNNIGMCKMQLGQFDQAEDEFSQAIRIKPMSKFATNLGVLHMQQGKRDKARDAFEKAVQQDPQNSEAWAQLGNLAFGNRDFASAELAWTKANAINPTAEVTSNLGTLELQKGDPDAAARFFLRATQLDPKYALAQFNLGVVYQQAQKFAPARDAYKNTVTLDPKYYPAHYNLALMHARLGDKGLAIESMEQFIKVAPPEMKQQIEDAREKIAEFRR